MVAPVTLLYLLQAPLFTLGVGVPVGRGVSGLAAARAVVGRAVGVAVVVAPVLVGVMVGVGVVTVVAGAVMISLGVGPRAVVGVTTVAGVRHCIGEVG